MRQALTITAFLLYCAHLSSVTSAPINWKPYSSSMLLPDPVKPSIEEGSFLILNNPSDSGMFAVFNSVLGALKIYEQGHYAGLKIDLNSGRYLDPAYGPNWWEYFFEPIALGAEKDPVHIFSYAEYMHLALEDCPKDRYQAYQLINQYIHLKPHIEEELNTYLERHFRGHFVIGVHYRGTDKSVEVPTVPYEKTFKALCQFIKKLPSRKKNQLMVYVATDDQHFLDYLIKQMPSRVLYNDFARSTNGIALHSYDGHFYSSPYQMGKEALLDCLLLSCCQALIRPASSGFSWIATCFNPSMEVIALNE